jgi:hypothetical protein
MIVGFGAIAGPVTAGLSIDAIFCGAVVAGGGLVGDFWTRAGVAGRGRAGGEVADATPPAGGLAPADGAATGGGAEPVVLAIAALKPVAGGGAGIGADVIVL